MKITTNNVPTISIQSFAAMCRHRGVSLEKAYYIVFGHQMPVDRQILMRRTVFPMGYGAQRQLGNILVAVKRIATYSW